PTRCGWRSRRRMALPERHRPGEPRPFPSWAQRRIVPSFLAKDKSMQNPTMIRKLGAAIAMWAMTAMTLSFTSTGTLSARPTDEAEGVMFREGFDDDRLPQRGWYDGRTFAIDRECARGGDGCIAYHWKPGTTTPEGSSTLRRLFEPTDTVYV